MGPGEARPLCDHKRCSTGVRDQMVRSTPDLAGGSLPAGGCLQGPPAIEPAFPECDVGLSQLRSSLGFLVDEINRPSGMPEREEKGTTL